MYDAKVSFALVYRHRTLHHEIDVLTDIRKLKLRRKYGVVTEKINLFFKLSQGVIDLSPLFVDLSGTRTPQSLHLFGALHLRLLRTVDQCGMQY